MKIIGIGLLAATLLACSSDPVATTDAATIDPVCAAIMDHCHPFASIPGLPTECHTLADANNGTVCRARQAECLAACVARDATQPTDAVTDAPATDAPATDAPATDTPATDAPANDAATDAGHMH